jgi:hypothetical protein
VHPCLGADYRKARSEILLTETEADFAGNSDCGPRRSFSTEAEH